MGAVPERASSGAPHDGAPAAAGREGTAAGAPGALLVIVSGPSGVGKDTVIDALRALPGGAGRHYVVTCTTRPRRPYEVNGVHYNFLDEGSFRALRDAGGLLESNEVHGHWYGTPRAQVRDALRAGRDVIMKIDDGDYRIAVDSARARIGTQQATIERIGQQIAAQQSAVDQARAQLDSAKADRASARRRRPRGPSAAAAASRRAARRG